MATERPNDRAERDVGSGLIVCSYRLYVLMIMWTRYAQISPDFEKDPT